MNARKTIVITLFLLVVIGYWLATRTDTPARAPSPVPQTKAANATGPPVSTGAAVTPADPMPPVTDPAPVTPAPRSEASRAASRRDLADPLVVSYPPSSPPPRHAADATPEVAADFDQITLMLRDYRTLTGENPVGTNAEIMTAIMGGNPKGAQLGPPDGQQLNGNGELMDRWGTPYFFHQLSRDLMEIHSAGPDRRMGNEDDLVSD